MASSPEYEDRIRELEKRYALHPGSLVFAQLADLYRKAGEPGRALEILEEGLEKHPDYLSAHIVLGRTCRDTGDTRDAVAAFSRVLELDGENLMALRSLGEMARERGDREEAREWYERLLQVDPLNEQVQEVLDELDSSKAPEADVAESAAGSDTDETPGSAFEPGTALDLSGEEEPDAASSPPDPFEASEGPESEGEASDRAEGPEPFRLAAETSTPSGPPGETGPDAETASDGDAAADEEPADDGIAADEAVTRAFDAVESWRRETAEADAASEAEKAEKEEAAGDAAGEEPERSAPGLEAAGEASADHEDDGPAPEEEALTAAWEEAYREEPPAPAEADEVALGPEERTSPDDVLEEPPATDAPAVEEPPAADAPAEEGPAADAPVEEEPAADAPALEEPASDDADEPADDEVFTETLAGLYARQGFYTEAVEIYEELLRRRPDDETLRQRMESARASRERTGERLAAEAPRPDRGDEGSELAGEAAPGTEMSAEPRGSGQGSVSIEEHLRALLRGEAPVGFTAGAPPVRREG